MKDIIIVGTGTVGYSLAQTLSPKHNVIVIDKNTEVLNKLQESIDVLGVSKDAKDPDAYRYLNNKEFDVFIAVTDSDEVNILSALISDDIITSKKKIMRLNNKYFAKSSIAQKLSIDHTIFPLVSTAESIETLLEFSKANNVKSFFDTSLKLVSICVKDSNMVGSTLSSFLNFGVMVVGVERNKEFLILDMDEVLENGDLVYFFGEAQNVKSLCLDVNDDIVKKVKKLTIFGAGDLSVEIANRLIEHNIQIKLIDNDKNKCKHASEVLQDKASVINCEYNEQSVFEDEQVHLSDMVIAAGEDDEKNIIKCLKAKEYDISQVIAINNDTKYYDLMNSMDIVAVRGPKLNAYYSIMDMINSSDLISQKHYSIGRAISFSRQVVEGSLLIEKTIEPISTKANSISLIVRGEEILPFVDEMKIEYGDIVMIFTTIEEEKKVREWIYSL